MQGREDVSDYRHNIGAKSLGGKAESYLRGEGQVRHDIFRLHRDGDGIGGDGRVPGGKRCARLLRVSST